MFILALVLACTESSKADLQYPSCVDTPSALAADAASPGGFSAVDALALVTGARSHPLTWKDGSQTALSLEVVGDGSGSQWVDSVAEYPSDSGISPAIGIECSSRLEIPINVQFRTDDGAFSDNFSSTLIASTADMASFSIDLVTATLSGSFNAADWPTEDYDTLSMAINASFSSSGDSGTIAGNAQKDNGCTDDGSCSASNETLDVAQWGSSQ